MKNKVKKQIGSEVDKFKVGDKVIATTDDGGTAEAEVCGVWGDRLWILTAVRHMFFTVLADSCKSYISEKKEEVCPRCGSGAIIRVERQGKISRNCFTCGKTMNLKKGKE